MKTCMLSLLPKFVYFQQLRCNYFAYDKKAENFISFQLNLALQNNRQTENLIEIHHALLLSYL